ncbi:unnamed protein product [Arctia plantaginis]|uniref:FP protein C-terminal domain-containing protein n=1 Tax=Arctia plantaginis TaxID=874455 RepID=A0A8S0ZZ19_ARCPL|nr:unnamed protein product [Arctia plantaginis]
MERHETARKVTSLEERLETLDRNLVKTSVELRNVPKRVAETKSMLYDSITYLSKQLNIGIEPTHIRDITRQPSKKENQTSNITLEFSNTLLKASFLNAIRQYNKQNPKNKVSSSHLDIKTTEQLPIYITEQLTSQAKKTFYSARSFAKANQYSFCWTSNGKIMLKKDTNSQAIIIKNEEHLKQLSHQNSL